MLWTCFSSSKLHGQVLLTDAISLKHFGWPSITDDVTILISWNLIWVNIEGLHTSRYPVSTYLKSRKRPFRFHKLYSEWAWSMIKRQVEKHRWALSDKKIKRGQSPTFEAEQSDMFHFLASLITSLSSRGSCFTINDHGYQLWKVNQAELLDSGIV